MFFDDANTRKPAGKAQLRLASESRVSGEVAEPGISEASRRHRAARVRNEPAGPSLLDRMDAISEKYAAQRPRQSTRAAEHAQFNPSEDSDNNVGGEFNENPAQPEHWEQEEASTSRREPRASGRRQENSNSGTFSSNSPAYEGMQDGAPLIDPRYVFSSVRKWRSLIAATTILGGLAGVYVALNTPHLYFSSATIVIDPRNYKIIENDLNPDVFLSEAALAIVDSQVSLMRSPRVLEKVAEKLKLAKDPEFNGSMKHGIGSFLNMMGSSTVEDYQGSALKYLAEHMSAERSPKTFVVNVGAYSQDPEKAALVANTIVDVYLEEQASTRSDLAKRTSGELGSRLDNLKADVESAEGKVEAFKSQNNLVGAQGRLIEDEEILRVNDQLTAARSTTITLNSRAQSAKNANVESAASGALPEEVASSTLTALRSQYVSAKQRRDGLSAKLGPMHPDLKQADSEIISLSGAIGAEINRIRTSIQTDLKRAVETEQQLATRLAQVKSRQGASGEAQVELRELEREAATARTVYEQYLLRARETGEQGNINANNVQKISDARSADAPEGASRKFIVLAGAIAGFIAGLGLAIAKGMFDALRERFTTGGETRPASSPSPPSSGGGSRRRMSTLISDVSGRLQPASAAFTPALRPKAATEQHPVDAPQPAYAPVQGPEPSAVTAQPQAFYPFPQTQAPQPYFQPQPAPVFVQQPVMQHFPAMQQPMFSPPAYAPVMVPYGQAMPQIAAQPMPVMMQQMPFHYPQPVAQAFPAAPQYLQTVAPTSQAETIVTPDVRKPVRPLSASPQDLQGSIDELRAELFALARGRRSA